MIKPRDQGYGIRFLPAYVDALGKFTEHDLREIGNGEEVQIFNLPELEQQAQGWIDEILER